MALVLLESPGREYLNGGCRQCAASYLVVAWTKSFPELGWLTWLPELTVNRPLSCWKAEHGNSNSQSSHSGPSHARLTV